MAAALAGCGGPAHDPVPANAASAADGDAAKIAALPERLRAGVLLRAIRDAGQNCQQITEQKSAGPAAWLATCEDHGQWMVTIADDGNATVADAKEVARRR